jgi:hypothetical protein
LPYARLSFALRAGAPPTTYTLMVASDPASAYVSQPLTITPTLLASQASGASSPVADATFTVTTANCGACDPTGCYDAAAKVIKCRPTAAGTTTVTAEGLVPASGATPVQSVVFTVPGREFMGGFGT